MKVLKTGQVSEYMHQYDLTPKTLDAWIARIPLIPYAGGNGQGDHRLWTLTQVVGIAVGTQTYNTARSCILKYVGTVMDAFGKLKEVDLIRYFDEGKTHFMMVASTVNGGDELVMGEASQDRVNVEETYRQLVVFISELEQKKGMRLATVA